MKTPIEIREKLDNFPWFDRCGVDNPIGSALEVRAVDSWSEAEQHFSGPDWETVGNDAANAVTLYLSSHHAVKYQQWNEIVEDVRETVIKLVSPKALDLQNQQGFTKTFCDCVNWDVLHALMTMAYADCRPPGFFIELLKIYEAGHFPCGWEGDWPNGTLLYI